MNAKIYDDYLKSSYDIKNGLKYQCLDYLSNFRGKILTIIEASIQELEQRKAIKDLIHEKFNEIDLKIAEFLEGNNQNASCGNSNTMSAGDTKSSEPKLYPMILSVDCLEEDTYYDLAEKFAKECDSKLDIDGIIDGMWMYSKDRYKEMQKQVKNGTRKPKNIIVEYVGK